MARHHKSFRNEPIDFDIMTRQNQHQVAVGNASLNARGDVVGKGGKVIQTVEQRVAQTAQMASQPGVSYNQNVKGAVQMVSIKKNVDDMAASFDGKSTKEKAAAFQAAAETAPTVQDLAREAREQQAVKAEAAKAEATDDAGETSKRKIVDKDG